MGFPEWSREDLRHRNPCCAFKSRFIFFPKFPVGTHKLEVTPKSWESTTEIGKIPAGGTVVDNSMGFGASEDKGRIGYRIGQML